MEFGKVDTDIQDIACVAAANPLEERGYDLRGAHGKIETILGVEYRAGLEVDSLVRAKEPRSKRSDFGVSGMPRVLEALRVAHICCCGVRWSLRGRLQSPYVHEHI